MKTAFQEASEAAAKRAYHANHICEGSCGVAPCAIHGQVGDDCDDNCLEAPRRNPFEQLLIAVRTFGEFRCTPSEMERYGR